jgi:putative membrane protein
MVSHQFHRNSDNRAKTSEKIMGMSAKNKATTATLNFYLCKPIKTITMALPNRFSQADQARIEEAVKQAEDKISGEIVPVFVEQSGVYKLANYRAAMLGATLAFISVIIFDRLVPSLAVYDPVYIMVIVVFGGILTWALSLFVSPFMRMLIGRQQLDRATRNKAENAFLEQEVFNTRHRTGIMIFISFFEHEVIVMADRGISKVVDQKEWDNLVKMLTSSIATGKLVDGLVAAIKRCGEILHEKGFDKTPDDVNELRDELRTE